MKLTADAPIMAPVAKLLPRAALTDFLSMANAVLANSGEYNEAVLAGWNQVRKDWQSAGRGRQWVRKDNPTSGDVHVDAPMGGKKKKVPVEDDCGCETTEKADTGLGTGPDPAEGLGGLPTHSTLYVHRPVLNGDEIQQWAKQQGFAHVTPAKDMHVTLAYSKQPFDTSKLKPHQNIIEIPPDDENRAVEKIGEQGAVGLRFQHPHLEQRHQEIRNAGASHDYPTFKPHTTISWDSGKVDPSKITPYSGPIRLGPEIFAPVKDDWMDSIREDKMKLLKIMKTDDEQRVAYGWASVISVKGAPFEDSQGDVIDADTLQKATTDFMMDVRRAMAMHERNGTGGIDDAMQKGIVVHSFPLTSDIAKALGLTSDMEGWIVGVKVNDDDVWKRVKSGELGSFSIGGRGYRVPIEDTLTKRDAAPDLALRDGPPDMDVVKFIEKAHGVLAAQAYQQQFKASSDQPRNDYGRWASGGGEEDQKAGNAKGWKTSIARYSLDPGKVGEPVGDPVVQEHKSAYAAMQHMHAAINANSGNRYQLISPDGKAMPMNEAYNQVFGEKPTVGARGYTYPRIGIHRTEKADDATAEFIRKNVGEQEAASYLARFEKYSSDQPRDANGQWTSGGGGETSADDGETVIGGRGRDWGLDDSEKPPKDRSRKPEKP